MGGGECVCSLFDVVSQLFDVGLKSIQLRLIDHHPLLAGQIVLPSGQGIEWYAQ